MILTRDMASNTLRPPIAARSGETETERLSRELRRLLRAGRATEAIEVSNKLLRLQGRTT